MLRTTDIDGTVGGEKAEPVGFLVGVDDLEVIALHPARIIPRACEAKSKLADFMLYGSPGSAQDTRDVIARDRLVGVEIAQQRLLPFRPGTKYLPSEAEFLSFLL